MKKIIAICLTSALLISCAGNKIEPEQTLPLIYETAYKELEKKNYSKAYDGFIMVESQFPSSPWAADALIMAAFSEYMDGDFAGALLVLDRFMRFYPGHQDIPYVMYLRGMCYYRQVSDVRREPGMSAYALQQFSQLVARYPNSPYAKNAENKILILKNYIAGKMMYSARSDMSKQNWPSAISGLQSVVIGAQETVMIPEAIFRLTESYTAIGLTEQADGYKSMLRSNYPDNEWTERLNKSDKN